MEMDGDDGDIVMWMYLMPLNQTLEDGYNDKFYALYILPQ